MQMRPWSERDGGMQTSTWLRRLEVKWEIKKRLGKVVRIWTNADTRRTGETLTEANRPKDGEEVNTKAEVDS